MCHCEERGDEAIPRMRGNFGFTGSPRFARDDAIIFMLDIKLIRENSDTVQKKIATKGVTLDIRAVLKIDEDHRVALKKLEDLRALKNKASEEIPKATADRKKEIVADMQQVDHEADGLTMIVNELEEKRDALLRQIPNLPRDDVKVGKDDSENEELRKVGEPRNFDFKTRDHVALGEILEIIDTERAARAVGSRFGYLKGAGALLEFALIHYALDTLAEHNFIPIIPPVFLKPEGMSSMGYLEHGGDQEIYHLSKDDLYLIGTSEQAIGAMHADETFTEDQLPLRYVGFSSCFRREAGAYGKDTRGILRVHQFDKVEMFSFVTPEKSDDEHHFFLALEEKLMQGLGIPYHVLKMCTGDLGAPASRKYDIEAWIPSENRYRETHSTSTCTDFQARRLNTKYKLKTGKNEFVHTVNGTAFAIGRTIIAILENYQEPDGSVRVPEVLQKYMNGTKVISSPSP